jgi:hypothetical protein
MTLAAKTAITAMGSTININEYLAAAVDPIVFAQSASSQTRGSPSSYCSDSKRKLLNCAREAGKSAITAIMDYITPAIRRTRFCSS